MTTDPQSGDIKTYVLIGPGVDSEKAVYLAEKAGYIPLIAKDGQSLNDFVSQIKTPANVICHFHGSPDGSFIWYDGMPDYRDLFSHMPREGILSITLGSCYGGTAEAERVLEAAPPGAVVVSLIGKDNTAVDLQTVRFAHEAQGLTRPVDFYLEALDNFNPSDYHAAEEYLNGVEGKHDNSDPNQAMPHIIGIGGKPAQPIDLDREMTHIFVPNAPLDQSAMLRAVARVQKRFDTNYRRLDSTHKVVEGGQGPAAEKALHASIDTMARELAHGGRPRNVEERRLALAITAAYLDESGDLANRIQHAKQNVVPTLAADLAKYLDTNKDHKITPDEIAAYQAMVAQLQKEAPVIKDADHYTASRLSSVVNTDKVLRYPVSADYADRLFTVAGFRNPFGGVQLDHQEKTEFDRRNVMLDMLLHTNGFRVPPQGLKISEFVLQASMGIGHTTPPTTTPIPGAPKQVLGH